MFQNIRMHEAVVMARTISTDRIDDNGNKVMGSTIEKTLQDMELIDDLLTIMKQKSLMNKKRGLKRLLSGRIDMELDNSSIMKGGANIHFNF